MKRSLLLPLCLLLVIVFLAPRNLVEPPNAVFAQDKPKCDLAPIAAKLNAFKLAGDTQKDMDALLKIQNDISAANIACNGMSFSGKGSILSNPIDIPAGVYRAALKFSPQNVILVEIKSVGEQYCATLLDGDTLEDRLDVDKGCRAVLQVKTYSHKETEWTVTLEPLK